MAVEVSSPFPEYAIPRVWSWIAKFRHRVVDDYGPKTLDEFIDHWQREEASGRLSWAVYRDGELGGVVFVTPLTPVLAMSHVMFKKEFWGRATTEAAMSRVYEMVFSAGVQKIQSLVFQDNDSIISLAKAMGAVTEGVFHNHTLRNGKPTSMVALALFKKEFEECLHSQSLRQSQQAEVSLAVS